MVSLLPGSKEDSTLYLHEETNYVYCKSQSTEGKNATSHYFKCKNTKCPGRAKSKVIGEIEPADWIIELTKDHNHPPDPLFSEVKKLRQHIINKYTNSHNNAKAVFDEECSR